MYQAQIEETFESPRGGLGGCHGDDASCVLDRDGSGEGVALCWGVVAWRGDGIGSERGYNDGRLGSTAAEAPGPGLPDAGERGRRRGRRAGCVSPMAACP